MVGLNNYLQENLSGYIMKQDLCDSIAARSGPLRVPMSFCVRNAVQDESFLSYLPINPWARTAVQFRVIVWWNGPEISREETSKTVGRDGDPNYHRIAILAIS